MTLEPTESQASIVQTFRGTETRLRSVIAEQVAGEPRPLWIECALNPARSWSGVRQLLAGCAERIGEEALLATLEKHPGPARLVLDHWQPSAPERAERESGAIGARIESHLTHNWTVQRPAMDGWARLLNELFEGRDFCLVVPFVNHLDWESLAVLKSLFRLPRRGWPRLILGYDDGLTEMRLDEQGIEWRTRPDYVRQAVKSFVALPGARLHPLLEPSGVEVEASRSSDTPSQTLPTLVEGRESAAREVLEGGAELDAEACRRVVEAMEACFQRFAFTTALWLGCELFRRVPELRGEPAASAHAIVALSAHNRQFRSQGNLALGRFIAGHLEAALREETRPRVRCALLYRLAVAYGRRLGEIQQAEHWARRAISEATALEDGGSGYQLAWAQNIMAYVRVRSEDPEGSRRSMQVAVDCACDPAWPIDRERSAPSSLFGDLALTRSLAVHNLAVAEGMCGEPERAWQTLARACRLEDEIEGSAKYWAQGLVASPRLRYRPDRALAYGQAGLQAAEEDREAPFQLVLHLRLADLSFRVGDAAASADHYLSARRLASKMEPLSDGYPDLDFPMASALEEAGRLDLAETLLRSKLRAEDAPFEVIAEAASRLAILAARRGDPDVADSWATQASDAAAEEGHRHCLVRTATHLGRAARLLERREDAIELLGWASDLYEAREDPQSISAADGLALLVELDRCGALPREKVQSCLRLVPEALSSPSAWWALSDLLKLWLRHDDPTDFEEEAAAPEALRILVTAGESRDDCRPLLPAAREWLRRAGLEHPTEVTV